MNGVGMVYIHRVAADSVFVLFAAAAPSRCREEGVIKGEGGVGIEAIDK